MDRISEIPSSNKERVQGPTCWSTKEKTQHLFISSDRLSIHYRGKAQNDNDIGVARANLPLPNDIDIAYYEVLISVPVEPCDISVGLSGKTFILHAHSGWSSSSCGYHSSGVVYFENDVSPLQLHSFTSGDVVGCGVNYYKQNIFFTLNGKYLGDVRDVLQVYFPTVGIHARGNMVKANFGDSPYMFDLEGMRAEQERAKNLAIDSFVCPSLDFVVYNYLAYYGYADTASAFKCSRRLPDSEPGSFDHRLEQSLPTRALVRRLVMDREAKACAELIRSEYPDMLNRVEDAEFGLEVLAYLNYIQKQQIQDAILFLKKFKKCYNPKNANTVDACCALLCYRDPSKSPLAYMLSTEEAERIADKLNEAILAFLGVIESPLVPVTTCGGEAKGDDRPPNSSVLGRMLNRLNVIRAMLRTNNRSGEIFSVHGFLCRALKGGGETM